MASLLSGGGDTSAGSSRSARSASKRGLPTSSSSASSRKSTTVQDAAANRKNEGEMLVYIADADKRLELLGKKRPLTLRSYSTVKEVKGVLKRRLNIPVAQQRLFFRVKNQLKELKNKHSLQDCGVCRSGETLLFALRGGRESIGLEVHGDGRKCPRELRHCLLQSKRALLTGKAPILSLEGTGGCYFLPDPRGEPVSVFKPRDEELFMVNNPRGAAFAGCGAGAPDDGLRMRHGIAPGASCYREVAAYALDTGRRAGVPETHLVESSHPKYAYHDRKLQSKLGSLCVFVPNIGVAEDYSFSRFPVAEVHKIAVFDLRILNCDRNAANLLVQQPAPGGGLTLVPIDHGFCLPDVLEIGWCDWCWLDWPQLKEPLDADVVDYVLREVDPERDARLLRAQFSLPEQCLCLLKLSGMLLQKGVRAGLNLFEIASLVVRQDVANDEHSELECVHHRANELAAAADKVGRSFREACDCSPPRRRRPAGCSSLAAIGGAEDDAASLKLQGAATPLWLEEKAGKRQRWEDKLDQQRGASAAVGAAAAGPATGAGGEYGSPEQFRSDDDSGRASPPGFWVEAPYLSANKAKAASLDDIAWNDDDDDDESHGTGEGEPDADALVDDGSVQLASTPSSVAVSPLGDDVEEMLRLRDQEGSTDVKCPPWLPSSRNGSLGPVAAASKEEFHSRFWHFADALLSDLVQQQLDRRMHDTTA